MTAADELERAGLRARMVGGRLQVGPPDRLTAEGRALVSRLAAALRAELSPDTVPADPVTAPTVRAPRFRAWRARFADGRTMTVLHPAGMDHAEALAAVDRWPGCTVEPLERSRLD